MGEGKSWFSKLFSSDADVDKSVLEYFNEGAEDYNRFAFSKARKKFKKAFDIATEGSVMQRVAAAGEAMARSGGSPGGDMTLCSSALQEDIASCLSEFAMLNILNTMRQDGWAAGLEPTETSFEVSAVKGEHRYAVRAFGMFGTVSGNGERIDTNGEKYDIPDEDNPPAVHDDYVVRTLRSAVKLELPIACIQEPLPDDFGHCPPHFDN